MHSALPSYGSSQSLYDVEVIAATRTLEEDRSSSVAAQRLAEFGQSTRPQDVKVLFDWKCGVRADSWSKTIAVIDIVKGTFGLIIGAYLAIKIFVLMTNTPDIGDLKRQMSRTEFIYIFAFGSTGWGVVLTVCGVSLWNFLLIMFGKILFNAVDQGNLCKLRLWYFYTFFSLLIFIGLSIRLVIATSECWSQNLCQSEHNQWVLVITQLVSWFSVLPTIYSLAVVRSLCSDLKRRKKSRRGL